jgi:hypothetical protein
MDIVQSYRRQRPGRATSTLPELRRNIACQYSRRGAVSRGIGSPQACDKQDTLAELLTFLC